MTHGNSLPAPCASDRQLSDLLRHVALAAVMLDLDARITFCNDYLLALSGWRLEDVIGRNYFELFLRSEGRAAAGCFAALLADVPDRWQRDNEIFTRYGEGRLMRWNNILLRGADGEVIGSASIGEDITERKAEEARMAYLRRVYAMLSGINSLIVRARDRGELFGAACRIAVETGGFPLAMMGVVDAGTLTIVPAAVEGKDPLVVADTKRLLAGLPGTADVMVEQAIREKKPVIANDSHNDPRVALREKHMEIGCRSMVILPLIVADEVVAVLALHATESQFFHAEEMKLLMELAGDIAFAIDHIDQQERLDYFAWYDALTGLANRTLFVDRLTQYLSSATHGGHQLGLLLIDLERFRNINDTLGRPAGDLLLRQVADWLTLAAGDAMQLTRIAGDHFALVLPNVKTEDEAARNVERIMDALLNHPFHLNGQTFRIAGKVGVAMYPDDGPDADTLIQHAEAALKKAKVGGDRYLFYAQRMTATVAGRLTLENQLRHALDREEFVLHYQPKVDLGTGRVSGAEALIRWNDPATGLVPPSRFIPLLEETGLIYEVGRWAMRRAMADYMGWRRAGFDAVRVAVNVSPLQLRHRDFVADVKQAISIDAHAAAGLELEITESMVMQDDGRNIANLHAIRAQGIQVAIDDFGTGFSSLSYLTKLPIDTLKIDRSFVADLDTGPQGVALVAAIINLAHALALNVVAEGVETQAQQRLLCALNCDEMQGFLFSKPLPAATFEDRYLAPRPDALSCPSRA
jgi:diguanylate cyclase (GGDEF)-like protein/PAS domain S-box-containing protein